MLFRSEKFRESQAIKGRKGGLIGGKRGSIEDKAKAGRISKGGGRPQSQNQQLLTAIVNKKAQGLSNRGIAEDLNISASTVSKYLKLSLE